MILSLLTACANLQVRKVQASLECEKTIVIDAFTTFLSADPKCNFDRTFALTRMTGSQARQRSSEKAVANLIHTDAYIRQKLREALSGEVTVSEERALVDLVDAKKVCGELKCKCMYNLQGIKPPNSLRKVVYGSSLFSFFTLVAADVSFAQWNIEDRIKKWRLHLSGPQSL